jgi:hypothetical protein
LSSRQNVLGCVVIPVVEAPAAGAGAKPEAVADDHGHTLYLDMSNYKRNRGEAILPRPKGLGFLAVV